MKAPLDFVCASLFLGAGAFISGVCGWAVPCLFAAAASLVSALLGIWLWLEIRRFQELRRQSENYQARDSRRLARGIDEGTARDAAGEPWEGGPL